MKLLHIVGDSRFGGAGRIILGLGQMAKREGWDVDILTTDAAFQLAVKRHGLGLLNLDVIRRPIRPLWDLTGLVRLRNVLKRESYQIVHTHTSKGGFVGRIAASLAGVPVVIHTMHGLAFHERSARSRRIVYSALERIAAGRCDRIVSVSEFHRQWAIQLRICKRGKILTIPNGVAARAIPVVPPLTVRRRLGLSREELMLLTMTRLAREKGLEDLIEAAALLQQAVPHCKIVIAGDGPERSRLERLSWERGVSGSVLFLGHREDVDDLLGACDLVVLPSLREGLSISLLEAMAAGKPIIASRIGSHVEVASRANMAKLVIPADARDLYNAVVSLIGDPKTMAELGANAQRLFEQHYREDRMLDAYRELYRDLLRMNCSAQAA